MHAHQLQSVNEIREFVLAGNARFTLVSKRTGARFTFKVRQPENKPYFVSVMTGTDNTSDYTFLGTIFENSGYVHGSRSRIAYDAPAAKAFEWFYHKVFQWNQLPDSLEIWHEGRCGRCGRPLTVPESIANGLGPECIKRQPRGS